MFKNILSLKYNRHFCLIVLWVFVISFFVLFCTDQGPRVLLPPPCELYEYDENTFFGEGTEADPYWVCIPEQIKLIGSGEGEGAYTLDKHYGLTKDIDLGGASFGTRPEELKIIGGACDDNQGFSGTLNGKGHKVHNYSLSNSLEFFPQEGFIACLTRPRDEALKDVTFVPANGGGFCDIIDTTKLQTKTAAKGTPFIVCSKEQLSFIEGTEKLSKRYALYEDIDFKGELLNPVGGLCTANMGFSGFFDGRGHRIFNYTLTSVEYFPQEGIFTCITKLRSEILLDITFAPSGGNDECDLIDNTRLYTKTTATNTPFIVCSKEQLRMIDSPDNLSKHYALYRNIDFGGEAFKPIGSDGNGTLAGCGTSGSGFSGIFDLRDMNIYQLYGFSRYEFGFFSITYFCLSGKPK